MIAITSGVKELQKLNKRIRVVPGGTSASKTFGILINLIDFAIKNPRKEISIVSESMPHLRRGAMKDFLKIMTETKRYQDKRWNRTLHKYTFTNGSYIEFFSVDIEEKVRGARRDVLFVNECNNIGFETYHQLSIRTNEIIWLDFNPSYSFWVHDKVMGADDTEVLTLTYKHNEALPESIRKEIEKARDLAADSEYWANWWNVYGLGQLGALQGTVFNDYDIVDSIGPGRLLGYGLDFGYSNDPTAVVALYKIDQTILFDEILYDHSLTNQDIAEKLSELGVSKHSEIIADSAEPKSIEELRRLGWRIYPAKKGADSINFGIDLIARHRFQVTKKSTNIINELRQYSWEKDKNGNTLNKAVDAFNHCIDSMRYICMTKLARSKATMPSVAKFKRK